MRSRTLPRPPRPDSGSHKHPGAGNLYASAWRPPRCILHVIGVWTPMHRIAEEEHIMGKLIVTEFVTLDGVAQAPGGPDEDRDGGFTHGGWQAPLNDEEAGTALFEQASSMDALLLGRRTYEIFANYWPAAPEEIPFTGLLNGVPKYVASRTLAAPLVWQGSTLVAEALAEGISSVKERHDEVHVIGSLNLVQSLLRFGLVDRMNLWMYPLLLGSGKRVFADGTVPTVLRLVQSVTYPNGTLHLAYEPAGAPAYGDYSIEEQEPQRPGDDRA
jgi:dihydrofolate reductase